jgi:hypothetical protein
VLAAVCIQLIWPPPYQNLNELRFLTPEEIAALAEKIIADSTKVCRPSSIPSSGLVPTAPVVRLDACRSKMQWQHCKTESTPLQTR